MIDFISSSSFGFVFLTIGAFWIGLTIQKKLKLAVFNPIIIGALIVMVVLTVFDIPNETYQTGCKLLSFLLTPATICLAISFYEQLQKLKPHLFAVLLGVTCGTVVGIGMIWALSECLGLSDTLSRSLLPKSVTTAIGLVLSEELGGIGAVTAAAIMVTGIIGNIAGKALCKLCHIKHPVAQGVAFGTASHVIGTSKATQLSELSGAVSSLSLTVAGILTAIILSFLFT
jgi:predicted murein hydrolase (TIGR00659 family)